MKILLQKIFIRYCKLTRNADKGKYKYARYGLGFDNHGTFSLFNGSRFDKNVISFGANMSFLVHVGNKNKNILLLGNRWIR